MVTISPSVLEGITRGLQLVFSDYEISAKFPSVRDLLQTSSTLAMQSMGQPYSGIHDKVEDLVREITYSEQGEVPWGPGEWPDRAVNELSYMMTVGMLSRTYFRDGDLEELTAAQIIVALPSIIGIFDGWFR